MVDLEEMMLQEEVGEDEEGTDAEDGNRRGDSEDGDVGFDIETAETLRGSKTARIDRVLNMYQIHYLIPRSPLTLVVLAHPQDLPPTCQILHDHPHGLTPISEEYFACISHFRSLWVIYLRTLLLAWGKINGRRGENMQTEKVD